MNKSELIQEISTRSGISKSEVSQIVDAFTGSVTDSLKNENDVVIPGFGSFSVSHRAEYQGRNPQTGESITIKAAKVARFKPGKSLKEAVNGQ